MSNDFASLKKSRHSQFEKLTQELTKLQGPPQASSDDDRFWKPEVDKSGNGYAIIRFLPAPQGEDTQFIRIWDHGFQGPGGWYIEKSLTTLGETDPVSEYNSQLWNNGTESGKEQARKQKRREAYISNIYVVKDPTHPENEGKVFLYKYGKKIFEKLKEAMEPKFEDEKPFNPFDMWEGANFKLKIRNVEGYRNYDKSEFDDAGPLLKDDEELERVWKSEHKLRPFLDRSNFKSYDELKAKLHKVLGLAGATTMTNHTKIEDDLDATPPKHMKAVQAKKMNEDDDDETVNFFKNLAAEED